MTRDELLKALDRLKDMDQEYARSSATSYLLLYINDMEIDKAVNKLPRVYK